MGSSPWWHSEQGESSPHVLMEDSLSRQFTGWEADRMPVRDPSLVTGKHNLVIFCRCWELGCDK